MATTEEDLDLHEPPAEGAPPESEVQIAQGEGDEIHDDEADEGTARVDTELNEAVDPAEREEIIKRRREARRNKNQRQKERMERLSNENRQLNERLSQLEQGFSSLQNSAFGQQLATVDTEIKKAAQAHQYFLRLEADAISKHNGPAATQARENATMARTRAEQLAAIKNNAIAASRQQQTRPAPPDPIVARHAAEFIKDHPWYKGRDASDTDSMILNAVDAGLTREGFDPRSETYWQELRSRTAKHVAQPIDKDYDGRNGSPASRSDKGRTSPVAGASSSASASSGQPSRLSPEQVQAIKDAGMWNDPAQRAKAIKAYQNYARTH